MINQSEPTLADHTQDPWLIWLVTMLLSGVVSYFTTTGTLRERLTQIEEREQNHYLEILRRLDAIERKLDHHA